MDAQDLVLHDADVLVTILTDTVQKPKADKSDDGDYFASAGCEECVCKDMGIS